MSHLYIKQYWVHYPTFLLWVFLQGLTSMTTNLNQQPRLERSPFQASQVPGIPMPPHVSLYPEVLEKDRWQEIVHLVVSQHRGWPSLSLHAPPAYQSNFPRFPYPLASSIFPCDNRLKTKAHHATDKGKSIASPSSPSNGFDKYVSSRMHLRDDFSHVISEIRPKGSTQPKENSERSKCNINNKGKIASRIGKYGF
jgi:hypothetical protein